EVTRRVIVKDTTPPETPTISSLPEYINADSITVSGTAEQNAAVTITGGAAGVTGVATNGSFSISVNLTQNAVNTLSATAKDAAGNISAATTRAITEDSTDPIVTVSYSSGWSNAASVNVTYSASDTGGSGLKEDNVILTKYTAPLDANSSCGVWSWAGYADTRSTGESKIILVPVSGGTCYRFSNYASDNAGNYNSIVGGDVKIDTTKPVITMSGLNPVSVEYGSTYTDAGATASDAISGNLTASITKTSNVNTNALGAYSVTYSVSDQAGNAASAVRTVNVVDTTRPVITRLGGSPVTHEAGTPYTDRGATAGDNVDGNITGRIITTNNVNVNAIGDYEVRYNVTDIKNNAAEEVVRQVLVRDTTLPVITRSGAESVNVEKGTTYTDAGATASDSFAGNLTTSIVVTNPVNTNAVGMYTVRYNLSDPSGNTANEVTRTVIVKDTTP
ncbi:MAG: immunoglobulin-like domain-containing protein, partial [Patescibacteria group bacterium]